MGLQARPRARRRSGAQERAQAPHEPITTAAFVEALRREMNALQVPARGLAQMSKVPVHEVEAWVRGERLPEPRAFARVVFALPTLRYLKPGIVLARQQAKLEEARAAERPSGSVAAPAELALPRVFAECLRALRERDGLDQAEVGALMGVTAQAVGAWEQDISTPIEAHYQQLLELWEELQHVPRPPARPIAKPDGGKGLSIEGRGGDTRTGGQPVAPSFQAPPLRMAPARHPVHLADLRVTDQRVVTKEDPPPPSPQKQPHVPAPAASLSKKEACLSG